MSNGSYSGYGYSNYSNNSLVRDYDRNGLIVMNGLTANDFREGANRMGLGSIGADVAQSAFNSYDRNHNGYLERNDAYGAYGSLHRLYY
jgi:Ca2+-binding EF-hand superfamily protein